jgi:aryl-alcohol dehydrogenase-like predicted oxidoreductase
VTAYGALSRGLLSGQWNPGRELTPGDFRAFSLRFQGDNLEHNLELVERPREIGEAHGASVAQIAIAWVLARGEDIVLLVGARRGDRLHEALEALDVQLSLTDLARIEDAVPAGATAGTHYATSSWRSSTSRAEARNNGAIRPRMRSRLGTGPRQ